MLKTSTILHLPDGRDMCWCEYGAPGGEPVIMIHGTPLCRTMWEEFSDTAENKNVRIIAPDRPGYGYSDYNIKDNLVYFPSDIECLMEHLAIDTCSICGVSGGSPYALMCALKIPGRIKNAVIVSGAGPYVKEAIGDMNANKAVYNIGKKLPGLLSLNNYIFVTKFLEKAPYKILSATGKKKMTGDDRLMFEDSGFLKRLAQVYRQANMRQKRTIKQNALNYDMMHTINWKIPLDKIDKKIHFMYGKEDRSIGDGSKYMAEQIQNGVKHEFENYGHFLAYRKKEYIFELITQEL